MKTALIALLTSCLISSISTYAQTADDVINKYTDAIGGKDKLKQVKTMYVESSVSVMWNDAQSVTYVVDGKGFRNEVDLNGQKVIQCLNEKGGWMVNPFMGNTEPQALPDDQYKAAKGQLYANGVLVDYAAKGYKAELLPKEDKFYKVKMTSPEGVAATYYFDTTSYYVSKVMRTQNVQGQDVTVTVTLSNYKPTDSGILFPYSILTDLGNFQLDATLKKIEFNKDIDPKIFDMPKS